MNSIEEIIVQVDLQSEVDWGDYSFVEDLCAGYYPVID